jgi:hypothetical protein
MSERKILTSSKGWEAATVPSICGLAVLMLAFQVRPVVQLVSPQSDETEAYAEFD